MSAAGSTSPLVAFAAEIAPVIDAVHAQAHQLSAPAAREAMAGLAERPPSVGLLIGARFALRRGSVPSDIFRLLERYADPVQIDAATDGLVDGGWLVRRGNSFQTPERTTQFVHLLYDAHATTLAGAWTVGGADVEALATLTQRLLRGGAESGGRAFGVLSPPYERAGDSAALLLFNRLAALRFHRSDAHVAAWASEGLAATEATAMSGEKRDRVEAATNEKAAAPYDTLSLEERAALIGGMRLLPG